MTKKEKFIECFEDAIAQGTKYVFTEMLLINHPATELIVNPIENAKKKLEYISSIYNDDLQMVKDGLVVVEIISFGFVENLSQLEYARNNGVN